MSGVLAITHRGRAWPARRLAWALGVAALALALVSAPAGAAFGLLTSWGGSGGGAGMFNDVAGLAADAHGNLYVADQGTGRIQEFNREGGFVRQWGSKGSAAGQLSEPLAVAVARGGEDAGDVYVTDAANRRVDEFTPEGAFQRSWGFGVADGKNEFEICTSSCQAGLPSGADEGGFETPEGIAVDPTTGDVYVSDPANSLSFSLYKFQPHGKFISTVGLNELLNGQHGGSFSVPTALATDSAGDLYIVDAGNDRVQELDGAGSFVRAWGWGVQKGAPPGELEVCTKSTECMAGIEGAGAGQLEMIGIRPAPSNIAVDGSGHLWIPEADNRRVQEFTGEGGFVMAFGWGVSDGAEALETCTTTCQRGIAGPPSPRFEIPRGAAVNPGACGTFVSDAGANQLVDDFGSCEAEKEPGKEPPEEPPKGSEKETPQPTGGGGSSSTGAGSPAQTAATTSSTPGVASTAAAIEALALGCGGRKLVLNDVYIKGARVFVSGSAARSLAGSKVKILFDERKQVATAAVLADGEYSTTAPLPPARIRESLDTRYTAEIGSLRSLHVKLTRRLLLEPPKASGTVVTLTGRAFPPLTRPVTAIVIEQQLECGRTTIAGHVTPTPSGSFHATVTVPASARAGIFTLKSKVAANPRSTAHGFTTYSLPLPAILG